MPKSSPAVSKRPTLTACRWNQRRTDRSWSWSLEADSEFAYKGCHATFLLLEPFGVRASAAAPLLWAEIARRGAEFGTRPPENRFARYAEVWRDWLARAERVLAQIGEPG